MNLLRKAMLPTAVVAGLLMFFGAVGGINQPQAAYAGEICVTAANSNLVKGPTSIAVGTTHDYWVYVEDGTWEEGQFFDVNLDDEVGHSEITSVHGVDITPTQHRNVAAVAAGNVCGPTNAEARAAQIAANKALIQPYIIAAIDRGESCSAIPPAFTPIACLINAFPGHNQTNDLNPGNPLHSWQDNDIDCGLTPILGGPCAIPGTVITAIVDSLAADVADGVACATLAANAEQAAIAAFPAGATSTSEYIGGQLEDYLVNRIVPCGAGAAPFGGNAIFTALPGSPTPGQVDGIVLVDVTCIRAGIFQLSFANEEATDSAAIEVVCGGDVDDATMTALPTTVEINPSLANVAHSLVWLNLFDRIDEAAAPGTKVTFLTDRCAIESSTVDTEDEFEAAEALFRANNALNPATAAAIESSIYATTAPDGATRQQEEVNSFRVTGSAGTDFAQRTIAAVILHCDPIHAPNVTPGPAVITAIIDRGSLNNFLVADNDDLIRTVTVTVVGPPAANGLTVTAAPATLACGEKATLDITVKDAIGQNVSDHTFVEIVTNAGGVLAGTGAVAGQAGLVSPISSTVAETFGGKVTAYLLTSTAHVGKYEVVVTTGGGGGVTGQLINGGVTTNLLGGLFTTQPISVQVTIECTVPVVAAIVPPAATAPRTGQGITPPSTGDAGLASTESNWVVGAVVAVVAALAVAGLSVKLVRDEE